MAKPKYTIADFNRDYPDEDACLEVVLNMVYPEGILCRKCGIVRPHSKLTGRKAYSCNYCGTHVYPLAGTIFEKSTTPLKSWFYAMYLMSTTRCGISAKQLERELGVTYKTAWRMFTQIRKLMEEDGGPLAGFVEVDETFVGGDPRYQHGQRPKNPDGSGNPPPPPPEMHPFIRGLVDTLPPAGTPWSDIERDEWLTAAKSIFALIYKPNRLALKSGEPTEA